MPFCGKCGMKVDEEVKTCPGCGAPIEEAGQSGQAGGQNQNNTQQSDLGSKISGLNNTEDTTADFDPKDIESNKAMGILSYISWLVLIPIFAAKDSKYARFHANQGLVLAITEIIWWVIYGILSAIFNAIGLGLVSAILNIVNIPFIVLTVIGIVNAAGGKAKKLPIIGEFTILK